MTIFPNDSIMLIACSNDLDPKSSSIVNDIVAILTNLNINVILSDSIYKKGSTYSPGSYRALELTKGFMNSNVKYIFDVSGGDLSNEILPYLDFDIIIKSKATYCGYSDLSVLLNSIYETTKKVSYYYNIKTILTKEGLKNFINTFLLPKEEDNLLKSWKYKWLYGSSFNGIIIGGNIRCTLKLCGTKFMPSFEDKILFLESYSGCIAKVRSFVAHYEAIGAFERITGIILGEFSEIDTNGESNLLEELFIEICSKYDLSLIRTNEIGHSCLSKGISIGSYANIEKSME